MPVVTVRPYQEQDRVAIEEIVYRTGYNGEDLTRRHYIDDKRLFFLIFAAYYVWYESEHCFVAVSTATKQCCRIYLWHNGYGRAGSAL